METATRSRLFACQQTQRATKLLMRCQWLHELLVQVRAPGQPAGEGSAAEKWGRKKKKATCGSTVHRQRDGTAHPGDSPAPLGFVTVLLLGQPERCAQGLAFRWLP